MLKSFIFHFPMSLVLPWLQVLKVPISEPGGRLPLLLMGDAALAALSPGALTSCPGVTRGSKIRSQKGHRPSPSSPGPTTSSCSSP